MRRVVGWMIVGALGCGGATTGQGDSEMVADVAVSAEPAASGEGHPSASTPRRVAQEPTQRPSKVPPPPQSSEADVATARELFKEGVEAVQSGDFARAEQKFQAAHALVPKPQILFNLGQVYLQEGKTREACEAFENWWLGLNPPDPSKRSQLPVAQCPNLSSLP